MKPDTQEDGAFETRWKRRFEQFAQDYEVDHLISGWSEGGLQRRLKKFARLLEQQQYPRGIRILDVGCAGGTYVRFLAERGYSVIGMDYSLPSLERARCADREKRGRYLGGDAYRLPFRSGCFDVVIMIGVLQTLEHPDRVCDEIARVLRPNGHVLFEILNGNEVIALGRRFLEKLKIVEARLHTYSLKEAKGWLTKRKFREQSCLAIYLPPRKIPFLARIFDAMGMERFLDRTRSISQLSAHAFFILAEKTDRKTSEAAESRIG